jgi:hypothetical protein
VGSRALPLCLRPKTALRGLSAEGANYGRRSWPCRYSSCGGRFPDWLPPTRLPQRLRPHFTACLLGYPAFRPVNRTREPCLPLSTGESQNSLGAAFRPDPGRPSGFFGDLEKLWALESIALTEDAFVMTRKNRGINETPGKGLSESSTRRETSLILPSHETTSHQRVSGRAI